MKNIRTIAAAEVALRPYVPLVAQLTGQDMTLKRISELMAMLGNPQDKIKLVHIAGTSGKTSTAYYMAALLQQSGKRVGLTVSPHVDSITERVQIDGKPLAEQRFCRYLSDFLSVVERMTERPSYFELLYAFSFYVFDLLHVDYAVIETGMGGLHDATNVAQHPSKLCIITDIGYDHMQVLGNTLEAIASQKAGIIHKGNEVVMYEQAAPVMAAVRERVRAQAAQLHIVPGDKGTTRSIAPGLPDFQRRNWMLAYRAYKLLARRDGLRTLTSELLLTQNIDIPARMEERFYKNKVLVMDGAHNEQKMATFIQSFKHKYPNIKPAVLLALKQNKESEGLGGLLSNFAARVIVTSFTASQDLPAISMKPSELAKSLRQGGANRVVPIANQHKAFEKLMDSPEDICVITGSFYLLSQLRKAEGIT